MYFTPEAMRQEPAAGERGRHAVDRDSGTRRKARGSAVSRRQDTDETKVV